MSGEGGFAAGRPERGGRTGGKNFSAPLGPANSGHLLFVSGASSVAIRAEAAMSDLFHVRFEDRAPAVEVRMGTVTIGYPRFPPFDWPHHRRARPAEVALNASIPWSIEVRDGASRLTADLSGLRLGSLEVSGGAGRVELTLPEPPGTVPVRVLGGANNLAVRCPGGAPARLRVEGGFTNLAFDGERFGA